MAFKLYQQYAVMKVNYLYFLTVLTKTSFFAHKNDVGIQFKYEVLGYVNKLPNEQIAFVLTSTSIFFK